MSEAIQPPVGNRKIHIAMMVVGGILVLALAAWGVRSLMSDKPQKTKQATKAFLVPDKPPPPPPPPKEKEKIQPKDEAKEVKIATPKAPAPVAQNEPLKMEGAAGDGNSPFGAGSVNSEYKGGSFGGSLYSAQLQRHLQEQLNRNRKLRESDYRVTLRVWIGRDGAIQRTELVQSTGSESLDELLKHSLLEIASMREPPPENTPMPIRIRVTARGAA